MKRIFQETLRKYCDQDYYPWHMPGHKRKRTLISHAEDVELDVTELPGLDNLHVPEGAIAESMKQLSQVYGSWKTYYLINGSTTGILTAISAVCSRGDTIILGRHCHKSVYNAVMLLELIPIYVYPELVEPYGICSSVSSKQIEEALVQHPEAKAVIFPSPTYEGVLSDIKRISQVVHKYGALLIVDEAHGAHLEFGANAPVSAVRCGADLVIQSLHKTLPCYTQCALLHICLNIDEKKVKSLERLQELEELQEKVERYLSIYQTSSPSYLFVANMEDGIATMEEWRNSQMVSYYNRLRRYREKWVSLQNIHLLTVEEIHRIGGFAYDESKLVFCVDEDIITGEAFLEMLEIKYGMVMEMASLRYVLAMTSVSDSEEAFSRLDDALQKLDQELQIKKIDSQKLNTNVYRNEAFLQREEGTVQKQRMELQVGRSGCEESEMTGILPAEAWKKRKKAVFLSEADQQVAGEFVTVYPPGIPVLIPGEVITESQIKYLQKCMDEGLTVHGVEELQDRRVITVIE